MKKIVFICLISLLGIINIIASPNKSAIITYQYKFNDKIDSTRQSILFVSNKSARLEYKGDKLYDNEPVIISYMDFNNNVYYTVAELADGDVISIKNNIEYEENWTKTDDSEIICGLKCKKATLVVNSNNIEVFYYENPDLYGTPVTSYGFTKGLILKTIYNGSRVIEAVNINYNKNLSNVLREDYGQIVSNSIFSKKINDNAVITKNIFTGQRINFESLDNHINPDIESGNVMRFSNGGVVVRKVSLPDSAWKYNIFAELTQFSDGDAYDRTGSVFIIPTSSEITFLNGLIEGVESLPYFEDNKGNKYYGIIRTDEYLPPVEMIRFFTGFGTRKYNYLEYGEYNWLDSVVYKQDISQLAPMLSNEAIIGVYISNFDKNGHIINLDLKFYPKFEENPEKPHDIEPLFNTVSIMENAGQKYAEFFLTDTMTCNIMLNSNYEDVIFSYISTGHGGWGNGDEFNKKPNTIIMDKSETTFIPWRYDCASYREKNPCSGNFYNGLSSSDLSRSNWCPGTISNPTELFYNSLNKGLHKIKIIIPQGEREGNSFNHWNISGYLIIKKK